mgnify:CR=1 FL=1
MIFLAFIAFAMPSTLQFFCFTPTDVIWSVAFSLSRIPSTSSEPTYADFFGFWITKVPAIFVVAYITAAIVFIPSMKATAVICSRED